MEKRNQKFVPAISSDKLTVEYEKRDFRTNLPNLAEELEDINSSGRIRVESLSFEDVTPHDPGLIEFIQRCSTRNEAFEIIDYLERREEISVEIAAINRKKIKEEGLKAFGPHITPGHYERVYRVEKKKKKK
ncbi:MAG: DUF2095 family protein [Promethearchaeota archaeon]